MEATDKILIEQINKQIKLILSELDVSGEHESKQRIMFTSPTSFEYTPSGMWHILQMPHQPIKDAPSIKYGAAGMMPYSNNKIMNEIDYKASVIIHSNDIDEPVAMFLGNPNTKKEFYDQIFWGLQYYGIKMLAERAPTDWEDYAMNNKLMSYLGMLNREDGKFVYGVPPMNKHFFEIMRKEIIEYCNQKISKIRFIALLYDLIAFFSDKQSNGLCRAWGYSLMLMKN